MNYQVNNVICVYGLELQFEVPYSQFQASYLQKAGKRVAIFERRHVIGGAAVTEEIIPGKHLQCVLPIRSYVALVLLL